MVLLFLMCSPFLTFAQIDLLQTTSNAVITNTNIVNCNTGGAMGYSSPNSYARLYNLTTLGYGKFEVTKVSFAVQRFFIGSAATFPVEVQVYASTGGAVTNNLTYKGGATINITTAMEGTLVEVPLAIPVLVTSPEMLIVVAAPNGIPTSTGFYIGGNSNGQTAPAYLKAPDCSVSDFVSYSDVGGANKHVVLFPTGNPTSLCPTGNIGLSTQAQVDQFKIDYPNCTKISGYLAIGGSVANTNGLSNISTITGSLDISNALSLTDINGLSNLTTIGQDAQITNSSLTNLNALSKLKSIAGYLFIGNNASLINVNGLSALTSVGQDIDIRNNTVLTDISGLKNTTFNPSGGFGLTILNNPALAVCNLPNFCTYLANPSGTYPRNIQGNLANCLNEQAVITACASPLPVTLTSFTAKANSNYALLQWETASEQNNKGFEVWRSGDDGKFIKINEVGSKNPDASSPTFYAFTDKQPVNGTNYYKLVQVDRDGKETELGVRTLNFSLSAFNVQLYPNPTITNQVTVSWAKGSVSSLKLIDFNGKVLQLTKPQPLATSSTITLANYPAGTYLLRMEGDHGVEVKKVVKL